MELLRRNGVLDESDPKKPTIIVPNWVYARHRCDGPHETFYMFCCVDHCSALLESLEVSIGQPAARPGVIAKLVAELETDTVVAPRNLSASLLKRLVNIAEDGGSVSLHSRAFAQWLHYAFPNECPLPMSPGPSGSDLEPLTFPSFRRRFGVSGFLSPA